MCTHDKPSLGAVVAKIWAKVYVLWLDMYTLQSEALVDSSGPLLALIHSHK